MVHALGRLVRRSRLIQAALSAWLLSVLIPGAQGSTQESPSKSILHLVVVKHEMRRYRGVASGTAFLISPTGTALTNSHLVGLVQRNPAIYKLTAIIGREFYGAKIVCANPLPVEAGGHARLGRDVAEIQLTGPDFPFEELDFEHIGMARAHRGPLPIFPALTLGGVPAVGDPVRVLGYGHRQSVILPFEWSATGTVHTLGIARDGTPLFRIKFTRQAEHGHSGSPVLNMKSEVVGIFTWIDTSDRTIGVAISRAALDPACPGAG